MGGSRDLHAELAIRSIEETAVRRSLRYFGERSATFDSPPPPATDSSGHRPKERLGEGELET
jgi:hypothetical protein